MVARRYSVIGSRKEIRRCAPLRVTIQPLDRLRTSCSKHTLTVNSLVNVYKYHLWTAEMLGEKKRLQEQTEQSSLGVLVWVESMKRWIETSVSICKIAKSDDQIAKKSLCLEIFGSNLKIQNKNPRFPSTAISSFKKPPVRTTVSVLVPNWCGLGDSNSWPLPWQGSALTTELNPHVYLAIIVANNQISCKVWWLLPDLNWGHKALQASALPTELKSHIFACSRSLYYILCSLCKGAIIWEVAGVV